MIKLIVNDVLHKTKPLELFYPNDFKSIAITPENETLTLYHSKYLMANDNGQKGSLIIEYTDLNIIINP